MLFGSISTSFAQGELLFKYYESHDQPELLRKCNTDLDTSKEVFAVMAERIKKNKAERKTALIAGLAAGAVAVAGATAAIVGSSKSDKDSSEGSLNFPSSMDMPSSLGANSATPMTHERVTTSMNTASSGGEQVTSGVFSNGQGAMIKISGGKVVAICTGNDYNGRENWQTVAPGKSYRAHNGNISSKSSDSARNQSLMMTKYECNWGNGLYLYF